MAASSPLPVSNKFICASVGLLRLPTGRSILRYVEDHLNDQHIRFVPQRNQMHEDIMLGAIRRETQMSSLIMNGRKLRHHRPIAPLATSAVS